MLFQNVQSVIIILFNIFQVLFLKIVLFITFFYKKSPWNTFKLKVQCLKRFFLLLLWLYSITNVLDLQFGSIFYQLVFICYKMFQFCLKYWYISTLFILLSSSVSLDVPKYCPQMLSSSQLNMTTNDRFVKKCRVCGDKALCRFPVGSVLTPTFT